MIPDRDQDNVKFRPLLIYKKINGHYFRVPNNVLDCSFQHETDLIRDWIMLKIIIIIL